jgi:hypothetical protein
MKATYSKTQNIENQLKTTIQIKFTPMKTLTSLKAAITILLMSFMFQTVNAQAYDFTLIQNSINNYTIAAIPTFDSGTFQPITQSYGFTLVFPDGVTISVDNYFPGGTNGTISPIDGAAVAGIDPSMADKDLFLITTDTAGLTFNAHTIGTVIPLVTLTVIGNPASGEIRILDNASTLASSAAINGALDAFIQVDVIDNGTVIFTNEFNNLTGDVFFDFATLSIETVIFSEFSLYPNPAIDNVYIKGNLSELDKVEIYNINGQLVNTINNGFDEIDISGLESAVYFVKLYSDKASKTMKLVKK